MTSFQNLYDKLNKQIQIVEDSLTITKEIRNNLPSSALTINDTSSVDKTVIYRCRNSTFGKNVFYFKSYPTIKHNILECRKNQPITFKQLCNLLTTYIFSNNLYNSANNSIICDNFLKLITDNDETTFFILLKNLRKIIN